MADTAPSDNFLIQPDNDFEKIISAPANGEGDAPAPIPPVPADEPLSDLLNTLPTQSQGAQDGEVSTTTETAGENVTEASEADQYDLIGSSEAEGFSNDQEDFLLEEPESDSDSESSLLKSSEPPKSVTLLDDVQPSLSSSKLDEPFGFEEQVIPDSSSPVNFTQPSAPEPEPEKSELENFERLIDFDSPNLDLDNSANLITPMPPQPPINDFPELIPTDINTVSDSAPQNDGFDSEADTITKSVNVVSDTAVAEQSASVEEEVTISDGKGSWLKGVDPRDSFEEEKSYVQILIDLIYWRDVKKTGVVFGTMLTVLLCLAIFSLVSVLAYLSLALLTVSLSFVVYKKIMQAVQKSGDGHPFRQLLDLDITLKEDKLKPVIQSVLNNVNKTAHELRRLFLIEDVVDSVKFGLMLWVSTYIGSWLNGITIVILAVIMIFTLPKVYETYQVQIDSYIDLAKGHIDNVMKIVQSKVPFLKKKEKAQ